MNTLSSSYLKQLQQRKSEIEEQLRHLDEECSSFDVTLFEDIEWYVHENTFVCHRTKTESGVCWVAKRIYRPNRNIRRVYYWRDGDWTNMQSRVTKDVVDLHNLAWKDPSFIISTKEELLEMYARNDFLDF